MNIKVRLTATQLDRLCALVPNLHDYLTADGRFSVSSRAYKLGMRLRSEITTLCNKVFIPYGKASSTLTLTDVEARVLVDRLEFAWEIASDNGEFDSNERRSARSYRAGITKIIEAAAKAGVIL